ncbi:DUF300-domain-containing protein [Ramaria rubella]|nr:DUF300-domain-containing protein [Ramaria rubella]
MVIRIMIMIPIYGISSYISLFSLQAAFFIDAIRDIYEAFVIYVFFQLLIAYLGGERSLLILLHGRPPVHPLFPVTLFKSELDASDPYTYLWLKRGILQYVQVKPVLAVATIILKAVGKFDEGDLKAGSGYLYISVIYNISISVALYCLAMFWIVVSADLRPFRPMPKFLCVKGILFFSFWQSFFISILVAAGAVRHLGPYTDASLISLALTDLFICLEMPLFAIAHMFAFSHTDYIDRDLQYAARMPLRYAFRDAFGLKDVIEDSRATLRGEGMDYRAFEPAEGKMHQGSGRDRRIRAGLRYAQGGKQKYWLPMPDQDTAVESGAKGGGLDRARNRATGDDEEAYAPLFESQARDAVRIAPDLRSEMDSDDGWDSDGFSLTYSDPHTSDDELYEHSRSYLFGDYNYPCIDVSGETARRDMWDEEERILRDQRAAYFSPKLNPQGRILVNEGKNYGATSSKRPSALRGCPDTMAGSKGKDVAHRRHSSTEEEPLDEEQIRGATVIDMESDRIPDIEVGGVKMKWSKHGDLIPKHQVRRGTSSEASHSPSSPSAGPSSPTQRRRKGRSLSPRLSPRGTQTVLPPDAVDLVVEDSKAGTEKIARDRRKGEPAVHGQAGDARALRKVYRRGYKAEGEEGEEADVEVSEELGPADEEEARDRDDEQPRKTHVKVIKEDDTEPEEGGRLLGDPETVEVTDMTVARAATPPLHARADWYMTEDDNPWRQ